MALHETSGLPFKIKPFQLVNNSSGQYSNTPEYKRYKELLTEKNIPYVFNEYKKNPGLYASVVQRPNAQADNTGYDTFGQNYGVFAPTDKKNEDRYTMNEPEAYGDVGDKETVLPSTARQAFIEQITQTGGSMRGKENRSTIYDQTESLSQKEIHWEADPDNPDDEPTTMNQWDRLKKTNLDTNTTQNNSTETTSSGDELTEPTDSSVETPNPIVEPEPSTETSVQDIKSVQPSTQSEKTLDLSDITVSDPEALAVLKRLDKNIAKIANPPQEQKIPLPPKMDGSNIV